MVKDSKKPEDGRITKLVTLFDNGADDLVTDRSLQSRGLLLEISYPDPSVTTEKADTNQYTARVVSSYVHPSHVLSPSQGSLQVISTRTGMDSMVLLGYGSNAVFAQFAANGGMLCDTRFASSRSWLRRDVQSYRALKFPWVGQPTTPPSAVLFGGRIYVSWNGATEVKHWTVEHSRQMDDDGWIALTSVDKKGFETMIDVDLNSAHRFLRVRALDGKSESLGVSLTLDQGRRWISQSNFGSLFVLVVLLGVIWYGMAKRGARRVLLGWLPGRLHGYRYDPVNGDSVELESAQERNNTKI